MKCITLTVDAIVPYKGGVLLIKRRNEPFKDHYALPGGIVEYGERVEDALVREVKEETGLIVKPYRLVGVYSDPDRDPRGHFVSVCFVAIPEGGELKANSDAKEVRVFRLEEIPKLAFDHNRMIEDAKGILLELIEGVTF